MAPRPTFLGPWGGIRTRIPEPLGETEEGKRDVGIPEPAPSRTRDLFTTLLLGLGIVAFAIVAGVVLWLLWYVLQLLIAPA
jgi:hypothetical protein